MPTNNQALKATHTRIITWLLTNPGRPLTACARDLDIPAETLYRITSTDAFRDALARETSQLLETLETRLEQIATLALDRLAEVLSTTNDPRLILDAMKALFGAIAPNKKDLDPSKPSEPARHLHLHVDPSTIHEARMLFGTGAPNNIKELTGAQAEGLAAPVERDSDD